MANRPSPYLGQSSQDPRRTSPTANEAQSITFTSNVGFHYRTWDAEADTYAFSAHSAGNSADEIAKQLILRGYAVTRAEVLGSLYLQGVQNARLGPMPAGRSAWDKLADVFTLAGFNDNRKVSEIHAALTDKGYTVTEMEVRESLMKQGKRPIE